MFGKNKNKKVGLCLMVVTSCFILAGLWAVLATPETALAHKDPADPDHRHGGGGGGGDGGGDKVTTCVQFEAGGSVVGDQGNAPYCHNKKEKITVEFSNALSFEGHLNLQTNSTDKAANGREIFIDFGTPVILAPDDPVNMMEITTTDDALADIRVLGVSANLKVGAHQEHEFNFLTMVKDDSNSNVNLHIRVFFYFTDGSRDSLWIRLNPDNTTSSRTCRSSDPVTVTYDGIVDELRQWRVETRAWDDGSKGACLSRSSECDQCFLDEVVGSNPFNGADLAPGHIALSFGFTVTAAP